MSRALWFAAGAASGLYVVAKARRTVAALSPDGLAARVAALGVGARMLHREVAAGMAEREAELRAAWRLQPVGPRLLPSGTAGSEIATTAAAPATAQSATSPTNPTTPTTSTRSSTDGDR